MKRPESTVAEADGLLPAELDDALAHGLSETDVRRQRRLLHAGQAHVDLVAPCTVGSGIERLADGQRGEMLEHWAEAAEAGRITKFVPASGRASRTFEVLLKALLGPDPLDREALSTRSAEGDPEAADCLQFFRELERFPFVDRLRARFAQSTLPDTRSDSGARDLLSELLDDEHLGYASTPKGLIEFHREGVGSRTAAEQQVVEGAPVVTDAEGRMRLHFTVPPRAAEAFRSHLETSPALAGLDLHLGFSHQEPATDTVSMDEDGRLSRTDRGHLLLRPGGHGALLANLENLDADLVIVKNIDNIQPLSRQSESVTWQRLLLGCLVHAEREAHRLLEQLRRPRWESSVLDAAVDFVRTTFGRSLSTEGGDDLRDRLVALLDRPLRVCGMVPNTGEPGGGPFWIREADGSRSKQIVETSEISDDESQQAMRRESSHFNPVLLALSLRDAARNPFRLEPFIDEDRYFRSRRSQDGTPLWALERPGLWNGSMSGWNTLFVEVPTGVFTPVKSVLDLLRPDHQPAPEGS